MSVSVSKTPALPRFSWGVVADFCRRPASLMLLRGQDDLFLGVSALSQGGQKREDSNDPSPCFPGGRQ